MLFMDAFFKDGRLILTQSNKKQYIVFFEDFDMKKYNIEIFDTLSNADAAFTIRSENTDPKLPSKGEIK